MTTEYGYPEGEVARVESKEQIEDPSIIRIGVIGDTVSNRSLALSLPALLISFFCRRLLWVFCS